MMFFLSKTVVFAMWLQKRCQSPSTYFYNNIQSNSIIYSLYSIRMSQYIKEVNLQGQLVFRMAPPEIVKPKIKRYVRSSTLENLFNLSGETKMLDRACNRYSLIQSEQLKLKKEELISQRCSVLKKKFKSSFNPQVQGKTVGNFFNGESELALESQLQSVVMNLKNISSSMPQKIYLDKKYHSQLGIKMMTVNEAMQISEQKEQYRHWLNEANNSTKSPNFNKMTYLVQKLQKKEMEESGKATGIGRVNQQYLLKRIREIRQKKKSKSNNLLMQSEDAKTYRKRQKYLLSKRQNKVRLRHLTEAQEMYYPH